MLLIALSLLLHSLWLIFSPLSQKGTLSVSLSVVLFLLLFLLSALFRYHRDSSTKLNNERRKWPLIYRSAPYGLFILIGILLSYFTLYPQLLNDRAARTALPIEGEFILKVMRNSPQYRGIDLKLLEAADQPPLPYALKGKQIRIYPEKKFSPTFEVGAIYQLALKINPRDSRNFPGNLYQRLQLLLYGSIGTGTILAPDSIKQLKKSSTITTLRQRIAQNLLKRYRNGALMAALSVGKSEYLTSQNWQDLRQTGTIHLVSISGLHLSFTALWGFFILKTLFGLFAIRKIPPYKLAAALSIIIAWSYALIAGLPLPTERAAIMFTVMMFAHLMGRPIFSFQSLAIALTIILLRTPLSLLSAGFWLSFTALAILILVSRITQTPWRVILLSQLMVSLLLMPLTQSFFGEVSLISPLINLIAIPLTTFYILPALMLGLLLKITPFTETISHTLLKLSDYLLSLFMTLIEKSAQLPYAALDLPKYPLPYAIIITSVLLTFLALTPKAPALFHYLKGLRSPKRKSLPMINILLGLLIPLLLATGGYLYAQKRLTTPKLLDFWLFPVGEGLSLLLHSPYNQEAILFDTGSYFRGFDSGRVVILPALKALNIQPTQLILSLDNQQHRGGTRAIRTQFPHLKLYTHPDLSPFTGGRNCFIHTIHLADFVLEPIPEIKKSCAYRLRFLNIASKEGDIAWIISDPNPHEWQSLLAKVEKTQQTPPKILLFPNQGRSRYFKRFSESALKLQTPLMLYSTKEIAPESKYTYQPPLALLNQHPLNSYYGAVHLQLFFDPLDKRVKIEIEHFRNSARFWWALERYEK